MKYIYLLSFVLLVSCKKNTAPGEVVQLPDNFSLSARLDNIVYTKSETVGISLTSMVGIPDGVIVEAVLNGAANQLTHNGDTLMFTSQTVGLNTVQVSVKSASNLLMEYNFDFLTVPDKSIKEVWNAIDADYLRLDHVPTPVAWTGVPDKNVQDRIIINGLYGDYKFHFDSDGITKEIVVNSGSWYKDGKYPSTFADIRIAMDESFGQPVEDFCSFPPDCSDYRRYELDGFKLEYRSRKIDGRGYIYFGDKSTSITKLK